MHQWINTGRPGHSPLMDRLFAGGCTALFLLLMGSAAQAALVYWG